MQSGLSGFHDYEIVEMLLMLGQPQRDVKPAAKAAIKRFGSLRGVLEAPVEELCQIKGIGEVNSLAIRFVQEVARKYLKDKIADKPLVGSARAVFD